MLQSTLDPNLSKYSDSVIAQMLDNLELMRKDFVADMDKGLDVEAALISVDRAIFKLDDELCARGL